MGYKHDKVVQEQELFENSSVLAVDHLSSRTSSRDTTAINA